MKTMILTNDAMGRPLAAAPVSAHRMAVVLAAGAARTIPVPTGARVALLNATGPVWVQYGGTAAVPTSDITDGSAPELNPGAREVAGLAVLGLAAPGACTVSLAFYG